MHTITKVPDITLQVAFVSLHRHSIDPRRWPRAAVAETRATARPHRHGAAAPCTGYGAILAPPLGPGRVPAGRDARPCVRSLASSLGSSSGRGLSSGRLVAFAAIVGTTPRSATLLPRLWLRSSLAKSAPRRQKQAFLGSNAILACVMWPSTPAEGRSLAIAVPRIWPSTVVTVSASAISRITWLIPTPTLCTLRPRRYRTHPRHSLSGGSLGPTRAGPSPAGSR